MPKDNFMDRSTFRLRGRAATAVLAATATLLGGCASTSSSGPAPASATDAPADAPAPGALASAVDVAPGDVVELTVWGMSCPKCATNLDQLLMGLEGVTRVHTDMSRGIVTVKTGATAPPASDLADAITGAGFTLMDMRVVEGDA